MLYVTTKNTENAHTSYHALRADRDELGGLYIPFQFTRLTTEEILAFKEKAFCQCVADVLNIFFSARLDAWDVACCIGTHPLKLVPMSHKITIAEVWNNPEWDLSRFVRNLNGRILGNTDSGCPSNWTEIGVRIAVLFGVYSKLMRIGLVDHKRTMDLAVVSGDFTTPMAAWYARKMGMPIGTIIYACNENSSAWELLHHGEVNTNPSVVVTSTPLCDVSMPFNMERLIYETLGKEEAVAFAQCCATGGVYSLSEEDRKTVGRDMFGAVVGQQRTASVIRNVYGTSAYLLSPYSALTYGALQDYRVTRGESGQALILTENGPLFEADSVAKAIGITKEALRDRIG